MLNRRRRWQLVTDVGGDEVADADARLVEGKTPPSQRVPLDRHRILAAAIGFIDERGLSDLTMRRVGAVLGVEAMSLYRYVPGREDMLDGVVESIVGEMYDDPDVLTSPQKGWEDFLQRLAHGVRRIALAHPGAFPLVASRPTEAPWIRPPLRNLRWVELFLEGLINEGFSDDAAVEAYRAFTSFLLGHLLLEVSGLGADIGPLDVLDPHLEDQSLAGYPQIQRLGESLAENHAANEFEESLESLLDRLQLLLTQSRE